MLLADNISDVELLLYWYLLNRDLKQVNKPRVKIYLLC